MGFPEMDQCRNSASLRVPDTVYTVAMEAGGSACRKCLAGTDFCCRAHCHPHYRILRARPRHESDAAGCSFDPRLFPTVKRFTLVVGTESINCRSVSTIRLHAITSLASHVHAIPYTRYFLARYVRPARKPLLLYPTHRR